MPRFVSSNIPLQKSCGLWDKLSSTRLESESNHDARNSTQEGEGSAMLLSQRKLESLEYSTLSNALPSPHEGSIHSLFERSNTCKAFFGRSFLVSYRPFGFRDLPVQVEAVKYASARILIVGSDS
mmetsp:Transcript_12667/g.29644  ORF Transcript_12667/g.29644 Transcript_12667/m.29644 type:complete len:125 (+) Transcript_12667:1100-1474(+)